MKKVYNLGAWFFSRGEAMIVPSLSMFAESELSFREMVVWMYVCLAVVSKCRV